MIFRNGSLKLIFMLFISTTTLEYQKIATDAEGVLNVRNKHKLQTRSLLFPPTAPTRVQFIGGIGIPVEDLHFESVTSGYVLKAEYFLPETADVFHQKIKPQSIHRRRRSVNESKLYEPNFEHLSVLSDGERNLYSNLTTNFSYTNKNLKLHHEKKYRKQQNNNNFNTKQKNGAFYRWIVYKAVETILDKSALNGHICMLRSICEHAAIPLNYEAGLLAEILHIILTPSASRDDLVRPENKNYLRAEILGRSGEDCAKAFILCTKSPMNIISTVFQK